MSFYKKNLKTNIDLNLFLKVCNKYNIPIEIIVTIFNYVNKKYKYDFYKIHNNGGRPFIIHNCINSDKPSYLFRNGEILQNHFEINKNIHKKINKIFQIIKNVKNIYHIFPDTYQIKEKNTIIKSIDRDDNLYFFNFLKDLYISMIIILRSYQQFLGLDPFNKDSIKKYLKNNKDEELEIDLHSKNKIQKCIYKNTYFSHDLENVYEECETRFIVYERINNVIQCIGNRDIFLFNSYLTYNKYFDSDYHIESNLDMFKDSVTNIFNLLNDDLIKLVKPYLIKKINDTEVLIGLDLQNSPDLQRNKNYFYHGNSILYKNKKEKKKREFNYSLLGGSDGIIKFKTKEKIISFYSPLGNSDVPYSYALSKNYLYFTADGFVILKISDFIAFLEDRKQLLNVNEINNTIFEKFDLSGFIYDFITIESDKVKGRLKYEVVDFN
jgi:hypothetical protein